MRANNLLIVNTQKLDVIRTARDQPMLHWCYADVTQSAVCHRTPVTISRSLL